MQELRVVAMLKAQRQGQTTRQRQRQRQKQQQRQMRGFFASLRMTGFFFASPTFRQSKFIDPHFAS
jgi:hypothetical protein